MKSGKHILSKSTYIRGLQCLKSLYLHKNRPFLRDKLEAEQLAKFRRGHEVGLIAQKLFPGGINCAPAHPTQFKKSVELTRELIAKETRVIYEAAFISNGVLIFLDILVKTETGWNAYEVKSSLSISETYLQDAALQYNVISGCGINPEKFFIIYLNKDFQKTGDIDIHKLFKIDDISPTIAEMQNSTNQFIEKAKEATLLKKSPVIDIGKHCIFPYPCDFLGHCRKNLPEDSVYNLKGIQKTKRLNWMSMGFSTLSEIPEDRLSEEDKLFIEKFHDNKEWINPLFQQTIRKFEKPLFLSFLVIRPAIPVLEGTKPFQPSIVGIGWKSENSEPDYYLAEPEIDPITGIQKIFSQLKPDYSSVVCILQDTGLSKNDIPVDWDDTDFVDLTELFSSENCFIQGMDSDASFFENLKIIHPEIKNQNELSPIMAGVEYLSLKSGEKEKKQQKFLSYLQSNLAMAEQTFNYLRNAASS